MSHPFSEKVAETQLVLRIFVSAPGNSQIQLSDRENRFKIKFWRI